MKEEGHSFAHRQTPYSHRPQPLGLCAFRLYP
jgi:hypothetical protein